MLPELNNQGVKFNYGQHFHSSLIFVSPARLNQKNLAVPHNSKYQTSNINYILGSRRFPELNTQDETFNFAKYFHSSLIFESHAEAK
jgi:hypothetical protein